MKRGRIVTSPEYWRLRIFTWLVVASSVGLVVYGVLLNLGG